VTVAAEAVNRECRKKKKLARAKTAKGTRTMVSAWTCDGYRSAGTILAGRKKWNLPFWKASENRTKIDLNLIVRGMWNWYRYTPTTFIIIICS
jgi:hypothetical protein